MTDHLLIITGKLAQPGLLRVMHEIGELPFTWQVHELGVSVAALITGPMLMRRLQDIGAATRILLPGRCRADLDELSRHFGVPVVRGPEDMKDLPEYFGKAARRVALDRHDTLIFAEIVDAPHWPVERIVARAQWFAGEGADVIDLGTLPDTPFPHLAETVAALKAAGLRVSVDSLDRADLLAADAAGADYVLSLTEDTLDLAERINATPIIVSKAPREPDNLYRLVDHLLEIGRPFFADAILEPIHYGFTDSIVRYAALRERYPDIDILMGIGNLTELTDADTTGINAILMGMVSELRVGAVLATQVSPHARTAIREADRARRIMFAARERGDTPQRYDDGLLAVHDRRPFPDSDAEVDALAAQVRDPNFRIQVTEGGVRIYNRDGVRRATDPFTFWPQLGVDDDAPHAFYLGVELARAQIAWQLGRRYAQDSELRWGCVVDPPVEAMDRLKEAGTTMVAHRHGRKAAAEAAARRTDEAGAPWGEPVAGPAAGGSGADAAAAGSAD